MKDFFISYTKADRTWAEWIAWHLEEYGYTVVIQSWDFRPGGNFVLDMQRAAEECERIVAVLSPDYLASEFTAPEWAAAFAKDPKGESGFLLPVRIRDCELKGLLSQIVYVDLVGSDEEAAKGLLLAGVKRERAKPNTMPDFPGSTRRVITRQPRFPSALPPVWNIPHQRNPNFTGRDELVAELRRMLTSTQAAALPQAAIHGLGGIGKTQLAVEYAYRQAADYDLVWWVRAEETATMAADFAALATALDLPEKDAREWPVTVEAVRRWLGQRDRWLLVFDNARTARDLRGYLPQSQSGHVIITSRDLNWGGTARSLEVKALPRDQSIGFLLKRTGQPDEAAARELAAELGDLPLALEQAAAYIEATGRSLADYLRLFHDRQREMLRHDPPGIDYPATVATTWELSFQQAQQASPAATELINLCAFLAPDTIPQWLLCDHAEHLPPALADAVTDELVFDDAIAALRRFSLIEVDANARAFTIHRLVQAVARDRLTMDERKTFADAAVQVVDAALSGGNIGAQYWPVYSELLPHALAVADHSERLNSSLPETERLVYQLHERALEIRIEALGPTHPDNATSFDKLVELYCRKDRFADAERLCRQALERQETEFGPDHPNVARTLIRLVKVLILTNREAEAKMLFDRAQAINAGIAHQ